MDVNPKDEQNVLLVQEKGSDKMNVVAGLDNDGKPKTVAPKQENEPDFLKLDKHSNVLENFLSNFMRQAKDPTHFGFFKVPAENIETNAQILSEMSQKGDVGKEFLKEYQVDTTPFQVAEQQTQGEAKQEYKPIDESRVDWKLLEQFGVTREALEKTNSLDAMLNWRKSPALIAISPKIDDVSLHTQARLSFREAPDGRIVPIVHALQKEPQLERELFGHSFTPEDKENLLKTGNMGRVANLVDKKTGEITPSFISIDKLTNELVALRADKVRIPNEIKGVTLDDKQKAALANGESLYLEGMTAKNGKNFNATVQVNADKRGIEFRFDNLPKQAQQQRQTPSNEPTNRQSQSEGGIRIPNKLGGVDLSEKEQTTLKEGGVIYVKGMIDKKGQSYNAYVKVNNEKEKLDFFKWNPQKKQGVTPDNSAKTQVSVNSDGKTNEATKYTADPVKNGQVQPTERQKQETEQKQEPQKRSKGVKM